MALDTALRRASALNPACPWRSILPFPDGAITAEDRRTVAYFYSGNVATAPVLLETIGDIAAEANTGTYQFDLSIYFTGQTSYSIAPAVEVGWTFSTTTGLLTIDTDASSTFGPYTVTASNGTGSVDSNAFTVKVAASTTRAYRSFSGRSGIWRYIF